MGLLGDIVRAGFNALVEANNHAESIRHGSSGMTNDELRRKVFESAKNGDYISAEGYKRAFIDNKNRNK